MLLKRGLISLREIHRLDLSREAMKMRRGEQALIILSLKVHLMIFNMKKGVMGSPYLHLAESPVQTAVFTMGSCLVSRVLVNLVIKHMMRGSQMRDLGLEFQIILSLVEAIHSDLMCSHLREKPGAPSVKARLQVISQMRCTGITRFYIVQKHMVEVGESGIHR